MSARFAAACCAILSALAPHAAPAAAADDSTRWLVASDLHLDPFDRSPRPARPGKDSNRALLDAVVAEMRRAVASPEVVVLPGDFLAHRFARLAAGSGTGVSADDAGIAVMREIAARFGRAFPKAQFALALGNNDAPCGDYESDLNGRFLAAAARIWAPLVDRNDASSDFARAFATRGYYTVALPRSRLRLAVLDTVRFSSQYRGVCGHRSAVAPAVELTWLKAVLRTAPRGTHVVPVMHVPPGYDAFTTELTRGLLPWSFTGAADGAALVDALSSAADRVPFAIAGHAHRFDFRLAGRVPIVVFGAVSPVYRNNPVFYALDVGPDGALRDVDAYAFDERSGRWIGPRSFDRQWQVDAVDATALERIHARLAADPAMRRAWASASAGWPAREPRAFRVWRASTWRIPWCAQTVTGAGFVACAGIEHRAAAGRAATVVFVLFALVGLAYAVTLGVRAARVRRRPRF